MSASLDVLMLFKLLFNPFFRAGSDFLELHFDSAKHFSFFAEKKRTDEFHCFADPVRSHGFVSKSQDKSLSGAVPPRPFSASFAAPSRCQLL